LTGWSCKVDGRKKKIGGNYFKREVIGPTRISRVINTGMEGGKGRANGGKDRAIRIVLLGCGGYTSLKTCVA